MPDLRQLRAFVAVAEERNFTRAAERLHLAQQAVSKSVRQLEQELGVELLERTTREVGLTRAGSALLEPGRRVLRDADAAFERAREVGSGHSGSVRIGASPAVGPATLQEVIDSLLAGAPDLSVSVRDVRPADMGRMLQDREVDFVVTRTARDAAGLDSAALRPTPVELALPEGHRLAVEQSVSLAQLDGERLMTWSPPGTPYTDLLLDRLAAAGAEVTWVESRVMGTQDLSELVDLDAVALVPAGWPATTGVATVAVEDDVTLPLTALWAAGPRPPALERVQERLADA